MLLHHLRNYPWFYLPFIIWVILGGIALVLFSQETLFFAVNSNHTAFGDHLMPVLSAYGRGDCISIVLCSLILVPALRNKFYLITASIFGILISIPIYYLKLFFACPRPITVFGLNKVHTVPWLENLHNNSFPSGHTLGAFGFFLFICFWIPKKHQAWGAFFFALALGVGVSRLYLGQHFFKDIYFGSIFGVVITTSIYLVCKHLIASKNYD